MRILANPGRGIVAALNTGAQLASAPYLARMDSDDIALPQRLARQIDLLERQPQIGIVATQVEIFTDTGTTDAGFRHYQTWLNSLTEPEVIRREIFIESPLPHPSVMLRRSVFERFRWLP